jgi:hypothetical protein
VFKLERVRIQYWVRRIIVRTVGAVWREVTMRGRLL